MKPIDCLPSADGCLRCQSAKRSSSGPSPVLLLGPENPHVQQTLTKRLAEARLPFHASESGVLVLAAASMRLPAPTLACLRALPDAVQENVKAAFFGGSLACASDILTAFMQAAPLTQLLAAQEHEWVRDALEDDWFFSLFHPIVHAQSGTTFAYEALIRARRPPGKSSEPGR